MEAVKVKLLKDFHGDVIAKAGESIEMNKDKADFHAKRGNVEIVKTKELKIKKENENIAL